MDTGEIDSGEMKIEKAEPLIVARDLTMIYKTAKTRLKALSSVDIDIGRGEFVAIVGTSGCGKTTLLSLLAGLEKPTAGRISIEGHGIHRMNENQLVRFRAKNTGFIFQSFHLFDALTAQENVAFPLMVQGVGRCERIDRAKRMLVEFGLGEHLHHRPVELSGGEQQRVSIARAIITKPKIVFADEPTGNLDSQTANHIMEILENICNHQGTTILMVTHDMNLASYADRIICMEDGRIIEMEDR